MPGTPPNTTLTRAREIARREGIHHVLGRSLRRILHPVLRVRHFLFFEQDLTEPLPTLEARAPLEMRVASAEDLVTFRDALTDLGVDMARARTQRERGDLLTIGLSGGTLVHAGWIAFSSPYLEELGVTLALGPGQSCGYRAVTHPSWRNPGIRPAGALYRNACQRARGCTRHIAWVAADNTANVRPQAARGPRRTKTVWSIWILGMRRPFLVGATESGSPSLVRPTGAAR